VRCLTHALPYRPTAGRRGGWEPDQGGSWVAGGIARVAEGRWRVGRRVCVPQRSAAQCGASDCLATYRWQLSTCGCMAMYCVFLWCCSRLCFGNGSAC
jgi:hypothetical protein